MVLRIYRLFIYNRWWFCLNGLSQLTHKAFYPELLIPVIYLQQMSWQFSATVHLKTRTLFNSPVARRYEALCSCIHNVNEISGCDKAIRLSGCNDVPCFVVSFLRICIVPSVEKTAPSQFWMATGHPADSNLWYSRLWPWQICRGPNLLPWSWALLKNTAAILASASPLKPMLW